MAKMKHAYEVNKHGNDPEVLDGSVHKMFGGEQKVKSTAHKRDQTEKGEEEEVTASPGNISSKRRKPNSQITDFMSKS